MSFDVFTQICSIVLFRVLKYSLIFFKNELIFSYLFSTTSSTASSSDTEFSKVDEQKLRDHIQQLKNDRAAVKMTVMELESVHIDPLSSDSGINPDAQRLDLENAVLMQELMAMKVGVSFVSFVIFSRCRTMITRVMKKVVTVSLSHWYLTESCV